MHTFWIDADYDRDNASDGVSRYGAYLRDRSGWFADCFDWDGPQPERFAALAWRIAASPIMSPGYIREHPRVLRHGIERSDWNGTLLACVDLVAPWPAALAMDRKSWGGAGWRDWPSEYRFGTDKHAYREPGGEDLAQAPHMLASVSLRFTVPTAGFPEIPADEASLFVALTETAQATVEAVVAELNRVVCPVIACIEGG